jgi:pSer/pThr/pTyr-binding forkhead associated (FHA) protein
MGRAPNLGAPQRVSAHVVPKAKPFSEEEEKTNIESDSQWGDEPSTTVEQGEVAEHLKALGLDAPPGGKVITGDGLDDSTVDDQNNPMMMTPPVIAPARLVITGGNDTGLETDVAAGKAYTIGRGLDNDIVLTDIAVSRKHFDLRNDGGSWVIVDRGSGNGTVVNGNLEDNPFMLANGDVIEIGNTTFRFDFQTGEVPRAAEPNEFGEDGEDEMSTVAGKPLHSKMLDSVDVELETKSPAVADRARRTHTRPKTLPPPVPLRPRTMSQPPAYPATHPQGTPAPLMSSTLPMPQMANRPPAVVSGPQSPTLLSAEPINLANLMPTTIPGQGVQPQMLGNNVMAQTMMPYGNPYPQATEIPPHSVHAQMLVVQQQHVRRGDMSTSHVPPAAFNGIAVPPRYSGAMQPLSKRTKYVIVLGAVMVFATIATVAIIKGSDKQHVAHQGNGSGSATVKVTPLPDPPTLMKQVAPPPVPPKQDPPKVVIAPPPPPKQDPPKVATVNPPKQDPPKQIVKPDPPKQDPPKQDPPKQIVRQDPPKQDPPKQTPHTQAKTDTRDQARTVKPPKQDPPKQDSAPKRVATTDAVERADGLYRDKKFIEAANVLATAQKSADSDEAASLKGKSQRLLLLAHVFNLGMAPATKPVDAFDALVQANNYDSQLGGHFETDISQRLAAVAPKAALSYAAGHNYDKAHTAVLKAESVGAGGDSNVKIVKQKLESEAAALYAQAVKDYSDNPAAAKEKLRQVKSMVDAKSPTYQKANAKLSGG